ncbi:MAG: phosphatase PAP2 family protein [Actinomycetota bacterium]
MTVPLSSPAVPGDVTKAPMVVTRWQIRVRLHWLRRGLLAAYAVFYVVWFANFGIIIDRISVVISVALLLTLVHLGRPWRSWATMSLDLALYSLMWLAYDETRGGADRLGMPLQVESIRNLDRLLFFGADPVVWMQDRFYSEDHLRWYDVVADMAYYSHFVAPIAVIVALWITNRSQWVRFMRRFATVLGFACVVFVLAPTAPPWMAGGGNSQIALDALPPVARPAGRGWDWLGLDTFVHAWETGRDWANQTAALPSLHAAFALFLVVFFFQRVRSRRLRVLMLVYPLTMSVSLVYLGEHYVVDLILGWVLVGASFALWARLERSPVAHSDDGAESARLAR